MPFLIIGVLIGMPLGAIAYVRGLAALNDEGRRMATRYNTKKPMDRHW